MTQKLTTIESLLVKYMAEASDFQEMPSEKNKKEPHSESESEKGKAVAPVSDWLPLAVELKIPAAHLDQFWSQLAPDRRAHLWQLALERRIDNVANHRTFRQATAERVAGKALEKIENLLDKGLIKSVPELLAVARIIPIAGANPAAPPSSPVGVTVNIGGPSAMKLEDGQSLPGGEEIMMINLNPRTAKALSSPAGSEENQSRIIDATMLDVQTLRSLDPSTLEARKRSETDSQE